MHKLRRASLGRFSGVIGILAVGILTTTAQAAEINGRVRSGELRLRSTGPGAVQFEVESLGGGRVAVRAIDESTTVNGRVSEIFEKVFGDVRIKTTGGDDVIRVFADPDGSAALRLPGELTIDSRGGDDLIEIFDLRVSDEVRVATGSGRDQLTISGATIGDDFEVSTGGDEDSITIADTAITDDLTMNTGGAADTVDIRDVAIGDDARLLLGKGDDRLVLDRVTMPGQVNVRAGGGVDDVRLNAVSANALRISTDAARDMISLTGTSDFFTAEFDGGRGRDTLFDDGTTLFVERPVVRRFENSNLPRADQ